jgi:very-short-patch-repair endonuclease
MSDKRKRSHPTTQSRAKELRSEQTPPEQLLWRALRSRQLKDLKFRRQHPIGRYIVDFYCARHKLVVEIDGDTHVDQTEYDADRTIYLNDVGYRVLRFTNRDVINNLNGIIESILEDCDEEQVLSG